MLDKESDSNNLKTYSLEQDTACAFNLHIIVNILS